MLRRLAQKCRIGLLVLVVTVTVGLCYRAVSLATAHQAAAQPNLVLLHLTLQRLLSYQKTALELRRKASDIWFGYAKGKMSLQEVREAAEELDQSIDKSGIVDELERLAKLSLAVRERLLGTKEEQGWNYVGICALNLHSSLSQLKLMLVDLRRGDLEEASNKQEFSLVYAEISSLAWSLASYTLD